MDHHITDSGLVISYTKSKTRIMKLQQRYGIGNVIYNIQLPNVKPRNRIQLISLVNLSKDTFYEIEVQTTLIDSKYDCEIDVYNYIDVNELQNSDIVILIGGNLKDLHSISQFNFVLYKWKTNTYISENKLDYRITSTEQELVELITSGTLFRYRHNYNLSRYLPMYTRVEIGTEDNDIFFVNRSLYKDSNVLSKIAEIFWTDGASSTKGIYLDIAVVRTYHLFQRPHLYPWIGIIETCDIEDVHQFLRSELFSVSSSMCLGLVVFNEKTNKLINNVVPTLVLKKPLYTESAEIWYYEKWLTQPTIVSIDSNGSCTVVDLTNGNKTIHNDLSCLYSSVLVITNKSEPYIGSLVLALGICTPIVLKENHYLIPYLEESNPIVLKRLNYSALKLSLTPTLIKDAFELMRYNRHMYTIESCIRRIASSKLGTSVHTMLNYIENIEPE